MFTRRRGVALVLVVLLTLLGLPAAASAEPALPPGDRFVGVAAAAGGGHWLASAGGGVYTEGAAPFHGSAGDTRLSAPIVAIAARPDGAGYWLAGSDGAVYGFGAAAVAGSMAGARLRQPVVGMASTRSGNGYWLVAADGGVFSFGDAVFAGSLGDRPLVAPIVGMAAAGNGGYWLVAGDGGVFSFGGAAFHGSAARLMLVSPVVGMAATPSGNGYWLAGGDGGIFTFGDAPFAGAGSRPGLTVTGVAGTADGGYVRSWAPSGPAAPANSGSGRRIVYSNPLQRVWLVGTDGRVERTYLVSGRKGKPPAGTYRVFSKSPVAYAGHDGITMRKMVRFAHGDRLAIGFHDIPRYADGRPMQTEDDLGGYRSSGCVRQAPGDAAFLWDWAPVGTTVVVV